MVIDKWPLVQYCDGDSYWPAIVVKEGLINEETVTLNAFTSEGVKVVQARHRKPYEYNIAGTFKREEIEL